MSLPPRTWRYATAGRFIACLVVRRLNRWIDQEPHRVRSVVHSFFVLARRVKLLASQMKEMSDGEPRAKFRERAVLACCY
jgi:hypothetical protein